MLLYSLSSFFRNGCGYALFIFATVYWFHSKKELDKTFVGFSIHTLEVYQTRSI